MTENNFSSTQSKDLLLDKPSPSKVYEIKLNKEPLKYKDDAYHDAGIFSRLFFCWVCKAMKVIHVILK